MTILGIDYGTQRVGIALSDATEVLAFPNCILDTSKDLLEEVKVLCAKNDIRMIVLGKSQDLKGNDNPVMAKINAFKAALETELKVPVMFQQEYWTSEEARRYQGKGMHVDASAAALILQRFLDTQRAQH
jgi:putative Holliday junction resolvase